MGSIEKKLSYLLGTKNAIREAIESKGVQVTDDHTFRDYADKIMEIRGKEYYVPSLPSRGGVNFYDYDGGVLHTYTKEEFLALTEMPTLPERLGLVCQGWNYTFEDAQAFVEEYGRLDIGAMYITDDGKTRLYITIDSPFAAEVPLYFNVSTPNSLVIDWGDGKKEPISGSGDLNVSHKYEEVGDYVIAFEVAEGAIVQFNKAFLGSNKVYTNMLKKAEIGNGVTSIGGSAFNTCSSLSSVVIPQGVTSIGGSAFNNCYSLSSIVMPQGVTSIGVQAFNNCYSLSSVVIPQGVTSIDSNAFNNCSSLVILDFSESTSVPTLSSSSSISSHAELRIVVPDSLYDEWIAATNWSSHASRIVKASEFNA